MRRREFISLLGCCGSGWGRRRAAPKQLGDIAASRDAYQKLLALSTSSESRLPELSEATPFLTN